ncbi:hypothetical protein L1987_34109 [Smallanthus sonchifolius]|uniref:Uncharacterized protein n=1 Tax=Smallanthus sonchifolius TaxID=185202 RepID=A0ACB9HSY4_9ASTR|nr:hypothetical protein L1987_34109 [Smallanthus sonchifolius]
MVILAPNIPKLLSLQNQHSSSIMNTQSSSESQIITIDVLKANHLLRNNNYRYLDVRTEEEFKKGHVDFDDVLNIPNMFNTPDGRVKNPNFMEQVLLVCTKDDHIIVGCQSGVRSVDATVDLLGAGFKHVYNMGGGYLAWVQNGLPVTGDTKIGSLSPTSPLPVVNPSIQK